MGLFLELNKFSESPVFGNGFFTSDQYNEMKDNHSLGTTQFAYGALNHIGISSTLAQSGIFGLL